MGLKEEVKSDELSVKSLGEGSEREENLAKWKRSACSVSCSA